MQVSNHTNHEIWHSQTTKNILKTHQKRLNAKHKNNNKQLSLIEERKLNTNPCYDGKALLLGKL